MAIKQVISQLQQKVDNGNGSFDFVNYMLGPELKYIGSFINSNNNNLEETLVLGTDKIIESQIDAEDNEIESIKFKRDNDDKNYYILTKTKYAQGQADIMVQGDMLLLNTIMQAEGTSARQIDAISFIYDEEEGDLYISPEVSIERDILEYINNNKNNISVAEKNIIQTYRTEADIRKKVIKEKITNLL